MVGRGGVVGRRGWGVIVKVCHFEGGTVYKVNTGKRVICGCCCECELRKGLDSWPGHKGCPEMDGSERGCRREPRSALSYPMLHMSSSKQLTNRSISSG